MHWKLLAIVVSTLLSALHVGAAQGVSFHGSSATAAGYCCVAPTEDYRFTNVLTSVVGPGLEFSAGEFISLDPLIAFPVPYDVDIGETTISLRGIGPAFLLPGTFNGAVLKFSGAPTILNVQVDPSSTYIPVGFSFTSDSILVNQAAQFTDADSFLLVNVTLAVPEPETIVFFLAGLSIVVFAAMRRKGQGA